MNGQHRPVFGWLCTYLPLEIIHAAGFEPHRLLPETRASQRAEAYLKNFCPYVRAVLQAGLAGTYSSLAGCVFVNSCDAMRRLSDIWRSSTGLPELLVLDLPRREDRLAAGHFRRRLEILARELATRGGRAVTAETLRQSISLYNRMRALLREIAGLARGDAPALAASTVRAAARLAMTAAPEDAITALEGIAARADEQGDRAGTGGASGTSRGAGPRRPRIVVTTGPWPDDGFLATVEEAGALVVAEDSCTGERFWGHTVAEDGDPWEAIARAYLGKPPCPRVSDTSRRLEYLLSLVRQNRAGAVLAVAPKFCDHHLYDLPLLKRELAAAGIPLLSLEQDLVSAPSGQHLTRLQAFLEVI